MSFRKAYARTFGPLLSAFSKRRKRDTYNPKREAITAPDIPTVYTIYDYNEGKCERIATDQLVHCMPHTHDTHNTWINVDGLRKEEVERLCANFGIHPLLTEDILSTGQRAKADDMDSHLFCLLPMLTYNQDTGLIHTEQLSIVLGDNYVISFQPDPKQDPFDPLREKLRNDLAPVRKKTVDYLAYCLIDAVVDDYFTVLEKLSDRLEKLEDEVVIKPNSAVLLKITLLRQEIMVVKRAISPVRELVNSFWHSDNELIREINHKYFKDIYDHISLAIEYTENYREVAINLQDLYMNQVNTRMNEVMKILTVVTTLLAPATVIGGIFGMNFDIIPFQHHHHGFIIAVVSMLSISVLMLLLFRKKGWF
ncbi:magnesium/cobalt transporter CorA [Taibaiella chishuiensis]|uniref:Magnesium transport protein CorA n=1 Tax=Taibaiella chishuiensis TaxID=1434707 RepID=A0A2P8D9U5_9BACT|nr:magnesium/cobalt transporter CorA [Taibaiella chishuiensis]PSK93982.1 magnesium transporter [Taibaiella chishuiensis]